MKRHRIKIAFSHLIEKEPVPIIADGAVARRDLGDGRIVPLLILDTRKRPDIDEIILAHQALGPGDVRSGWSFGKSIWEISTLKKWQVSLILTITNPGRCVIILEFDAIGQGGVADQIMHSQGLYIQPGKPGDRLRDCQDAPRILVEVPSKHLRTDWTSFLLKATSVDFRKRGMPKHEARKAAEAFVSEWRRMTTLRFANSQNGADVSSDTPVT